MAVLPLQAEGLSSQSWWWLQESASSHTPVAGMTPRKAVATQGWSMREAQLCPAVGALHQGASTLCLQLGVSKLFHLLKSCSVFLAKETPACCQNSWFLLAAGMLVSLRRKSCRRQNK